MIHTLSNDMLKASKNGSVDVSSTICKWLDWLHNLKHDEFKFNVDEHYVIISFIDEETAIAFKLEFL